ncbi:MAG: helix-hairpin-helix domain-containing protein [Bacilli bacterium]|nr:helix-hairpin-helix domain-containing protein [Bacilli bacterium]
MKCLNYIKQYKFIILFIVTFFIIIFLNLFKTDEIEENVVLENNMENTNEIINVEEVDTIKVDIKGAVNNPGVYELNNNSRVSDAINISGGLTDDADTSIINLSKLLKDEMVVIIYTKKEIQEMKKGTTTVKYIEKECICPKLENDACIEESVTNNDIETSVEKENVDTNVKISLNKSTLKELMTLSGIGESKAKAIIEYREKNNGFKSIEEIKNVSGIGNSTYEKIKDNITI